MAAAVRSTPIALLNYPSTTENAHIQSHPSDPWHSVVGGGLDTVQGQYIYSPGGFFDIKAHMLVAKDEAKMEWWGYSTDADEDKVSSGLIQVPHEEEDDAAAEGGVLGVEEDWEMAGKISTVAVVDKA